MTTLLPSENAQSELPTHAATPARAAVGSDPSNPRASAVPLRATVKGDTLAVHAFACGRCHQASLQAGSGWIRWRGLRVHVCTAGKATAAHRAARARANLPEVAR